MNVVFILLMILLFFGGITLLTFSVKVFRQKKNVLGIVLIITGLIMLILPTIMIVTTTILTLTLLNN
jgi:hypothetical protein